MTCSLPAVDSQSRLSTRRLRVGSVPHSDRVYTGYLVPDFLISAGFILLV